MDESFWRDLWQKFFNEHSDPWVLDVDGWDKYCYFCGNSPEQRHEENCIYEAARKALKEPEKEAD